MSLNRSDLRLGSLEARVMRDLWVSGESTVTDVAERLNSQGPRDLAYNTVMSVMSRLADKNILVRRKVGRAFRYTPTVNREGLQALLARREVRVLLSDYGDAAIAGFVTEAANDAGLRQVILDALNEQQADGHGD